MEIIQMTLRLPADLHARLAAAAERDRRSKHAQALTYVERGLAMDEFAPAAAADIEALGEIYRSAAEGVRQAARHKTGKEGPPDGPR